MRGIFIGLGSNLPFDTLMPHEVLQQAVRMMPDYGLCVLKASSIYETPPFPDASQPKFANAVVEIETQLSANDLLKACLDLEQQFDRCRDQRWGARTLDIDVLCYNEAVLPEEQLWGSYAAADDVVINDLVLPHPRLHKRAFVVIPFCDIAPQWVHPVLKKPVDQLLDQIRVEGETDGIKRISSKLL